MQKFTGTVSSYHAHKGFGFIQGNDGRSRFVHIKQVREQFILCQGDEVEYEIGPGIKEGQVQAINVEVIRRAEKVPTQEPPKGAAAAPDPTKATYSPRAYAPASVAKDR